MDPRFSLIDNSFQLRLIDGDLESDDGLETAVIISLFTNRRVPKAEIPEGLITQEGWWGDIFPDVETDQIGSTLWTFSRSKFNPAIIPPIEDAMRDSLNWMIDDGLAQAIDATASFSPVDDTSQNRCLLLSVSITKPDGDTSNRFGFLWDGQEVRAA